MQIKNSLLFVVIALLLLVYTFIGVDDQHHFIINLGWSTTLMDAKIACYLIAGLGFCFASFYAIFSKVLYSNPLIFVHVLLYAMLSAVMLLWDNNIFSMQEMVDANVYYSKGEFKDEYSNVLEWDQVYRVSFWVLLSSQTIGLLNLILGFFKSNKD